MKVDFYGLVLETPRVTCYLWSPWRAAALEHRLFEVVRQLPATSVEQDADELRLHISDAKTWCNAIISLRRVLKGWQEEGDTGRERRGWRWLFEGDTDDTGYDHNGERQSLWAFLRLSLDRGGLEEGDKGEDVDLDGFGIRFWPENKSD